MKHEARVFDISSQMKGSRFKAKRPVIVFVHVTCASSLFNAGVEEKLIRERTGHRSASLFKYEKPRKEKISEVSSVLGPSTSATEVKVLMLKML